MKEMPTAILPPDSEYVYQPDSDTWIVQKKTGNKILSKKNIDKPAPMNDPFAPYQDVEQRGPKEISEFDPEYKYLINLVNAVVKAGVPVQEIKTLSNTFPFETVNDISDLIGHIWDLTREKYHIPQASILESMSKKKASLDKKAEAPPCVCGCSLKDYYFAGTPEEFCKYCAPDCMKYRPQTTKKAYEGGYPTEEDATTWGAAAPGTYAYQPGITQDSTTGLREGDDGKPLVICPKCQSDRIDKEGDKAVCNTCGTNFIPEPDRGSDDQTVNDYSQNYFWGPQDLSKSHQNQPGANGWLPAGSEDMEGPSPNSRMSSFVGFMQKQSNLNRVSKKEEEEYPKISKPKSGYVDNGIGYTCGRCEYFNPEREKCKKVEGTIKSFGCCNFWDGEGKFKEKNKTAEQALETDKRALTKEEAVYVQYPNVDYRCDECAFFNAEAKTCTKVDGEISPTASCNFWQPIKNKQANLNKQANPPSRFWIAPDGKEFSTASAGHGAWIKLNKDLLQQYGINISTVGYTWPDMINKGWTRVSNEPSGTGFTIEVTDLAHIPTYIDDFIAKYFSKGDIIVIGSKDKFVQIDNPFPSIQKAVNKELMHSKQASLLDEVLDQTTQDAIAAEYGPSMLIAMRFYNDAVRYGQSPDRAMAYALEEIKRMHRPVEQKNFLEVLDTYF